MLALLLYQQAKECETTCSCFRSRLEPYIPRARTAHLPFRFSAARVSVLQFFYDVCHGEETRHPKPNFFGMIGHKNLPNYLPSPARRTPTRDFDYQDLVGTVGIHDWCSGRTTASSAVGKQCRRFLCHPSLARTTYRY